MAAMSASQRRATDSTRVCSTALRSKVERLMTLSTSAVAVCCCSDSRSSLSSRVFSMAMTACAAKFCDQLDLLVGERPHLLAIDADRADQLVVLEHRHQQHRPRSRRAQAQRRADRVRCRPVCRNVVDVNHLLRRASSVEARYLGSARRTTGSRCR